MMRQRCRCGTERDVPAWDRSWEPDAAADADRQRGRRGVQEEP